MIGIFELIPFGMKTSQPTINRLPLQTCLLINQSVEDTKLEALLTYLLEPSIPTVVYFEAFESALKSCPHPNVILVTNDFNGVQEKLESHHHQALLQTHSFYILSYHQSRQLSVFSYTPNVKYINGLDGSLLPHQLKCQVQRELRFIRKKILALLTQLTRAQHQESIKHKSKNFHSKLNFLVHSYYTNPRFTTAVLAREMQISLRTLERKTVALTGKTPKQYLLEYRLQKAKYDLVNSYQKVGFVAKKHGFTSPSYFSVSFFERFGINPSQARQKERVLSVG